MVKPLTLKKLVQQLLQSVPTLGASVSQDLEKQFLCILQSAFENMNLVTREEFDAQVKVLARTRQKLTELAEKLHQDSPKS